RGRALLALHDVELDPLPLREAAEAVGLDGGVVDEAVLVSVLGRDEAESLGIIEPLHRSCRASHSVLHVGLPTPVRNDPGSGPSMDTGLSRGMEVVRPDQARSSGAVDCVAGWGWVEFQRTNLHTGANPSRGKRRFPRGRPVRPPYP